MSAAGQEELSPPPLKLCPSHSDDPNSLRELNIERSACWGIPQPGQLLIPAHVGTSVCFRCHDTSLFCLGPSLCLSPALPPQTLTWSCRFPRGALEDKVELHSDQVNKAITLLQTGYEARSETAAPFTTGQWAQGAGWGVLFNPAWCHQPVSSKLLIPAWTGTLVPPSQLWKLFL